MVRDTVKIAVLSTPHVPTPPRGYGASELIAGQLAEGFTRLGHDVRLFANDESTRFVRELRFYPEAKIGKTFDARELTHVARALAEVGDCDIVHNHCVMAGPPLAAFSARPMVTTLHYLPASVTAFPEARYACVSQRQRALIPQVNVVGTVHNGVNLDDFPLTEGRDHYLLFLGRFHPVKGADLAIEIAEQVGIPLIIAAPGPPDDQLDWFNARIKPRLGGKIEWIGPVEGERRAQLYRRAIATLVPIRWEEPFGLVMAESMACGTPPIALRKGAAPEIIADGETGFLCDDLTQMAAAVERAGTIDPAVCRRRVVENFTVDRMVSGYLRLFEQLLVKEVPAGARLPGIGSNGD